MKSDNVRNKYWSAPGVMIELGQSSFAKLQKVQEAFSALATQAQDLYTDWVVK